MIDVDRIEEQLDLALSDELRTALGLAPVYTPQAPAPPPRRTRRSAPQAAPPAMDVMTAPARPAARPLRPPEPPRRPTGSAPGARDHITALLRAGCTNDVMAAIASQRAASESPGATAQDRAVAALWTASTAILQGRSTDARAASLSVRALAQEADDPAAPDLYWSLRYWVALDWGSAAEREELLDECRQRAYCRGDLQWRAALSLACARTGRTDEAARELDAALNAFARGWPPGTEEHAADIVTNLVEAAALLRDAARGRQLQGPLAAITEPVIVDARSRVCKGSIARYRALAMCASRQWDAADIAFQQAVDSHRAMGALPLVARTLYEWGLELAERGDPRSWQHLGESTDLARRLDMTGPIAGRND